LGGIGGERDEFSSCSQVRDAWAAPAPRAGLLAVTAMDLRRLVAHCGCMDYNAHKRVLVGAHARGNGAKAMGGLMRPEFLLLIIAAMLLFGAKRLPEMGAAVGKTIKEFQKSMKTEEPQVTPPANMPSVAAPAQPQVTSTTPAGALSAPAATSTAPAETPAQ
jgi:sec-independent protein translocase protein TatA